MNISDFLGKTKLSGTSSGLLGLTVGKNGVSGELSSAGRNFSATTIADTIGGIGVADTIGWTNRYERKHSGDWGGAKLGTALRSQYGTGDRKAKRQVRDIRRGKAELVNDTSKAVTGEGRARSLFTDKKRIYVNGSAFEEGEIGALVLGVVLQHEAYRDGKIETEQEHLAESVRAVRAHTEMALRMQDTGKNIAEQENWLKKDINIYKLALATGDAAIFESYTQEFYNSEGDFLNFSFLDKENIFANWCNKTIDTVIKEKQRVFDNTAAKVKNGETLTDKEKKELKKAYELIIFGGQQLGYKEAADLLSLYLNPKKAENYKNEKKPYKLKTDVYKNSVIGKYAMEEMKKHILADYDSASGAEKEYSSADLLSPTNRDPITEGYFSAKDRVLVAEQNNQRLKNMDNRFHLNASVKTNKKGEIEITWSVTSRWDFESYEGKKYYTELSFSKKRGQVLKIDDGLSQYLTKIGMAREFYYRCEWKETL